MPEFNAIALRKRLREWFLKERRALPWRTDGARDPYSVVVSEVMLQQTQVATVLRYYERWMRHFGSFEALASAPEEDVLKAWEGMGYYSRARNLQKLARSVVDNFAGKLPPEVAELEKLPGVGPYSARSIASLAFGVAAACVDGNVVRVLARVAGVEKTFANSVAASREFQKLADEVLDKKHPGEHNEAMMELGATVCTKRSARCEACPLKEICEAQAAGKVGELPRLRRGKAELREIERAWVMRRGRLLLHKGSPAHGKLEGLWELPEIKTITAKKGRELLKRTRAITKYKIVERIFEAEASELSLEVSADFCWADEARLAEVTLSGPHRRWIGELLPASAKNPRV